MQTVNQRITEVDHEQITGKESSFLRNRLCIGTFLTELTGDVIDQLELASWASITIHTTAPTSFSAPNRVGRDTNVGKLTWDQYRAQNPGSILQSTPRIRVLSVYTEELGLMAWDLDFLPKEHRAVLLRSIIEDKTLILRDASQVLGWLFEETDARPSFLLDSSLLLKHVKPGRRLWPFQLAASNRGQLGERCKVLIKTQKGKPQSTLEWDAIACGLRVPDLSLSETAGWCVSPLMSDHFHYVEQANATQREMLRFVISDVPVESIRQHLATHHPYYLSYSSASIRLAEAHARGVVLDTSALEVVSAGLWRDIKHHATQLALVPAFKDLAGELIEEHSNETNSLKQALFHYALSKGIELSMSDSGTSHIEMIQSGLSRFPAWISYSSLRSAKSEKNRLAGFLNATSDGRLHSVLSISSNTGRVKSYEPALQNISKKGNFRSILTAPRASVILSADYAAIELRIGCALVQQSITEMRLRIEQGEDHPFIQLLRKGLNSKEKLQLPENIMETDFGWQEAAIPVIAQTVLSRNVQCMTQVFRGGLDPHWVTGLDILRRQGKIDFSGSALRFYRSLSDAKRKELNVIGAEARNMAKAMNFGLLYGQRANGLHEKGLVDFELSWSRSEAVQARRGWLELYPEFHLWQCYIRETKHKPINPENWMIWQDKEPALVRASSRTRRFSTTTLSGRPMSSFGSEQTAFNYQCQGSCADIIASAISMLPESISNMLLFPVHDELVFQVPETDVTAVSDVIRKIMIDAADSLIRGHVPVIVDINVSNAWS